MCSSIQHHATATATTTAIAHPLVVRRALFRGKLDLSVEMVMLCLKVAVFKVDQAGVKIGTGRRFIRVGGVGGLFFSGQVMPITPLLSSVIFHLFAFLP